MRWNPTVADTGIATRSRAQQPMTVQRRRNEKEPSRARTETLVRVAGRGCRAEECMPTTLVGPLALAHTAGTQLQGRDSHTPRHTALSGPALDVTQSRRKSGVDLRV